MKKPGPRLSAEHRREQIIDAAEALLIESGHLPLALEKIGQRLGISRALIYARFATQHDLINAILRRQFDALTALGLEEAIARPTLLDAALAAADLYCLHVARHGPVIGIILRDAYALEGLDPALDSERRRIMHAMTRRIETELQLGEGADAALLNMVLAIPEEAGRLIFEGRLEAGKGRALCARLTEISLESLRPRARAGA